MVQMGSLSSKAGQMVIKTVSGFGVQVSVRTLCQLAVTASFPDTRTLTPDTRTLTPDTRTPKPDTIGPPETQKPKSIQSWPVDKGMVTVSWCQT
jgi:hypothetical protein